MATPQKRVVPTPPNQHDRPASTLPSIYSCFAGSFAEPQPPAIGGKMLTVCPSSRVRIARSSRLLGACRPSISTICASGSGISSRSIRAARVAPSSSSTSLRPRSSPEKRSRRPANSCTRIRIGRSTPLCPRATCRAGRGAFGVPTATAGRLRAAAANRPVRIAHTRCTSLDPPGERHPVLPCPTSCSQIPISDSILHPGSGNRGEDGSEVRNPGRRCYPSHA